MISRNSVELAQFNPRADFPYELRPQDFQMAMQDVYDFFYDVNSLLARKDGIKKLRNNWIYHL